MASYVLVEGSYSRWVGGDTGKRVKYSAHEPGNNVIHDLTDAEVKSLGAKIRPVGEVVYVQGPTTAPTLTPSIPVKAPDTVAGEPDKEEVTDIPTEHADLLSKSVPEIEKELEGINDVTVLDAIQQEESAGKQRVGVLRVIKSRREELS